MELAIQLRVMRALRGMSQQQLSEKTGIAAAYISALESGKTLPSQDWERRLKAALCWPEDETVFALLAGGNSCNELQKQPA